MSTFTRYIKRSLVPLLLLAGSCIEPYDPHIRENLADILVVEGFMNATDGTASVKLSHSQTTSDTTTPAPEFSAKVSILSSRGTSYSLSEQDSGKYTINGLTIDKNAFYTLHIKTKSGTEYISDTVRVRATPPIDSLNFGVSGDGESLTILLTTHDPLNQARYYKWDFIETYRYNAIFYSGFHLINGQLKFRKQEEQVYACWRTVPSSTISIGTSSGLAQGTINRHLITNVPRTSPKISVRYSILVRQMAISKTEYEYLSQLKNTTEGLGGIFGTMPTSVTGNIHRVGDALATVLGNFSGAEIKEKRFFVERLEMPEYFKVTPSKQGCVVERICETFPPAPEFSDCIPREIVAATSIVLSAEREGYPPFFTFTSPECGDCRTQGGVTKRPDFW